MRDANKHELYPKRLLLTNAVLARSPSIVAGMQSEHAQSNCPIHTADATKQDSLWRRVERCELNLIQSAARILHERKGKEKERKSIYIALFIL